MRWSKPIVICTLLVIGAAVVMVVAEGHRERAAEFSTSGLTVTPAETVLDGSGATSPETPSLVKLLLRNRGGSELRIKGVVPSCGACTVVENLSADLLRPGEEAQLIIRTRVPEIGEKTSYVDVFCDSTSTPVIRATIVLKGRKPTVPYLTQIRDSVLMAARPGHQAVEELLITALESDDAAPWLCGVNCDDDHFQATLSEPRSSIGAHAGTVVRQYDVRLVFNAPRSGKCYGRMHLTARDSAVDVATVQIAGEAKLPLRAIPDSIVVSAAELPSTRTTGFVIDGERGQLVIKAEPAVASFVEVGPVEYLPDQSLLSARVEFRITRLPEDHDNYYGSAITVRTGEQSPNILTIPLTIT